MRMNNFHAVIVAWLDASIEVKMVFPLTGLLGAKCNAF